MFQILNFNCNKLAIKTNIAVLSLIFLSNLCTSRSLLEIPDNVRVDSEVLYNSPRGFDLFEVEEFVDKQAGSLHLKVSDVVGNESNHVSTSYYRVKEVEIEDKNQDEYVMSYNYEKLQCSLVKLNDWKLKGLTKIISRLLAVKDLTVTKQIENDRSAIGPLSLMRIFYLNSNLFKLNSLAFDQIRLTETYFFQAIVKFDDNKIAKLICAIPQSNVQNKADMKIGETLLSEVDTLAHPTILIVVLFTNTDYRIPMAPWEIDDISNNDLEKLTVSFYLVQERSTSKQGFKLGSVDERNPFLMPPGAGCGLKNEHNSLYVAAKQFSGSYEAINFAGEHFIAYDSLSDHLRIDSYGDHKMIYDISSKRITYMRYASGNNEVKSDANYYISDRTHCASTYMKTNEETEGFTDIKDIEDVLGLDKYVGLMYLGTTWLEDGTNCIVFEREISWSKIPLISRLNLGAQPKKDDRIFLVYYFVNEFSIEGENSETNYKTKLSYETLWLKRIELHSLKSISKYKLINSQVTFNEFSWTLESMAEEGAQNHHESYQRHPVRIFDTIECKSTSDQMQLDLIIKESKGEENDKNVNSYNWDTKRKSRASTLEADTVEEMMMEFIAKQTRISRSKINEFELVLADSFSAKKLGDEALVFIRAIIIPPMNFVYDRNLIGWIKSIDSFPFEKYGSFLKAQSSMTRYECSMSLATKLDTKIKDNIYMIYCPNAGCAYSKDISSMEFIKKEQSNAKTPSMSDNYYMCEIYLQKKVVDLENSPSNKYLPETLEKALKSENIVITEKNRNSIESDVFRGQVMKVSVTEGLSLDSLGSLVKPASCLGTLSHEAKESNKVQMVKLVLGLHHSVVHCHKACHLFPNCQSYSYHKLSRECKLTNIPKSHLLSETDGILNIELKDDKSCNIYETNSIHLYKINSLSLMTSVSGLNSNMKHYFTTGNLIECSSLCHLNELNPDNKNHCQGFKYFPLMSVCAIEDKESYLINSMDQTIAEKTEGSSSVKQNNFIQLLGEEKWKEIHQCHMYARDYEQYYNADVWTEVELKSKSSSNQEQSLNGRTITDELNITKSPTLYDISREDCLRECTLINSNCVMVDYCFGPVGSKQSRYCNMFNIHGVALKSESTYERGTGERLLMRFTEADGEKEYFIARSNLCCTHFKLKGDNLVLKMMIVEVESEDDHQNFSGAIQEIASDDLKHSESNQKKFTHYEASTSFNVFVMMMVSFFSGIVMFILGPILGKNFPKLGRSISKLKLNLTGELRRRIRRTGRSMSRVEFNVELENIDMQ